MTKKSPTDRRQFGTGVETWLVDENHVDMTAGGAPSMPATLQTDKESLTFDGPP